MYKLLFLFLLIPKLLFAQKSSYTVTGSFDKGQENKYAYLSIQKTDDRQEELIVIPIVNNRFSITKEIDKKGRLLFLRLFFLIKMTK